MSHPRFFMLLALSLLQLSLVAQGPSRADGGKAAGDGGKVGDRKDLTIADYERLINHYRYYKQDSAIWFADKAIDFARRSKDSNGVGLILVEQGMIDDNQGRFEESEAKYRRSLEIFNHISSKKGIATANIRLGVVKLRNGNYDKAIGDFLEALKVSEKAGDKYGVMEADYSISWAYLDQQNYDLALQYLKLASALNDSLPFSSISLNIYNNFGAIYREKGDFMKARHYLEMGIARSDTLEYQGLNITLINTLASVYSKEGFRDKAIDLQLKALGRSRAIDNYLRELQTLYGLAKTYGKEDPANAIFYLKQAVDLAREKKAHRQEIRYLKLITEMYQSQGDYKDAFIMKSREHSLADSFFYKTMSQNIASLKSEYELSKSNARIKELSYMHQMELEKSKMIRNVGFAGFGLLLIILGLTYNQYRIKQRSNREISQKNRSLQHLLDEKEWLLKEIHHRVKNNLHTVMSLLESQSAYLENDALTAIRDSQHRVFAMSLIHQRLYQSENVTTINMTVYLPELVNYLRDSFNTRQQIRFQLQIDPIELDVSQAVPLGLILNESITNAIKYAFPDKREGVITISMVQGPEQGILLTVADNGIGLEPGFDSIKSNSLGMRLMKGLSEDIDGKLTVRSQQGTTISIAFEKTLALHQVKKITSSIKAAFQS